MTETSDEIFYQQRSKAFDRVIALIDERIKAASPSLLLHLDEISPDSMRQSAEKETWSLFQRGIRHLQNGAPRNQPGSITEALSRMSLRSSSFAAALGVKPPQFEQIYFSVDYTTGHEAALFFCHRLIEAAEGDLSKSKQIIHLKLMSETPSAAFGGNANQSDLQVLKRQMAFSLNVLAETYGLACHEFKENLTALKPD
jgi:hypothetical protein